MSNEVNEFDETTIRSIFGHEAAEDDDVERLKKFYFKNTAYARLRSDSALRILIGHKGIGKSAMLTVAAHEDIAANHLAILLRPDDISEISTSEDVEFNAMIRKWKEGLLRIIQGKVVEFFSLKVDVLLKKSLAGTWVSMANDFVSTIEKAITERGVRLDNTKKSILKTYCSDKVIRIYVDDLDRGWDATPKSVSRMSAMLNAMRDISRDYRNIKFIISLRSDVFYLVRTSDESTDKLEGACIWFSWTNHEILAMLIKRIKTYFGLPCPSDRELVKMKQSELALDLRYVMSDRFNGSGPWSNIPTHRMLMTLIRRRPRDLVKLCTLAARNAYEQEHNKILTEDFNAIFSRYSQDRLQDAINEYKSELPKIQELLINMKPSKMMRRKAESKKRIGKYAFETAELLSKIGNICQGHRFKFYGAGGFASSKELLHFLYKIGFITARKEIPSGEILRHFFEDQNYVSSQYADFGYAWEVHPAYRWALSPAERSMFSEIDLLEDDVL